MYSSYLVSTIWSYAELVNNFDFENFGTVLYIWLGKEVMNTTQKRPFSDDKTHQYQNAKSATDK